MKCRYRIIVGGGLAALFVLPCLGFAQSLGSAARFAILAGSTVAITCATTIIGSVGVSPGTAITGLPAGQPTGGTIHAGDDVAAQAQSDLTIAYNSLAGMACVTNLTGQDLGGQTLAAGVYCFDTSAAVTGTLTLDGQGNANAVFVFQIGSTLTTATSAALNLIGAAQPTNVYWQVGSSATLGTGTAFGGNIVALGSITLTTGAQLDGRALARTGAVTMDTNTVGTATTTGVDDDVIPKVLGLYQNVPNPFNPTTQIRFDLAQSGKVQLRIYDVAGRLVRTLIDTDMAPGRNHSTVWNGLDDQNGRVASGVYFYRLESPGASLTRKLVVMK